MKTSLKNFLTDLYEIDPTLRTHEAELIPLIEKLLASDPAQEPDTEFVKRLRMELKDRVAELSAPESAGFSRWLYALGGAVMAAVVLPVAFVAYNQMKPIGTADKFGSVPMFSYNVTDAGKNAFGSLTGIADGSVVSGRGGGGGGGAGVNMAPVAEQAMPAMDSTAPSVGTDAKMMPPMPMTMYEYVYEGALPEFASTVAVYKRNVVSRTIPFSSIGSSLNLGSIDLASFAGMNMDTVTFSQNKPYGYQITVNLRDASVYLDAQWDQWPQSKCQAEACFQAERVKLSDIPSEDQLIAVANAFIKEHGIDVSMYAPGEVDMQWKRDYDRAPNTADAWIPDQMRVMYPLQIDGHKVTDQSGAAFGISVGVHVKSRKVMNIYGMMSRDYEKSDYAGVTDEKPILDYLDKLDNFSWMSESDRKVAKTTTVILGEPTFGYTVYQKYDQAFSTELLVPSLTFPVQEVWGGDPYFYRYNVVVPLAAEMLQEQLQQRDPMPMPADGVRAM